MYIFFVKVGLYKVYIQLFKRAPTRFIRTRLNGTVIWKDVTRSLKQAPPAFTRKQEGIPCQALLLIPHRFRTTAPEKYTLDLISFLDRWLIGVLIPEFGSSTPVVAVSAVSLRLGVCFLGDALSQYNNSTDEIDFRWYRKKSYYVNLSNYIFLFLIQSTGISHKPDRLNYNIHPLILLCTLSSFEVVFELTSVRAYW